MPTAWVSFFVFVVAVYFLMGELWTWGLAHARAGDCATGFDTWNQGAFAEQPQSRHMGAE